jgi:hypothetical protein
MANRSNAPPNTEEDDKFLTDVDESPLVWREDYAADEDDDVRR